MQLNWAAALGLLLAGAANAGPGGVAWDGADAARAKSAATGAPVCYFFTNNAAEKNGST